mmetsp:Transcript_18797/g.27797  ORF Transcript_18797/g.27797 Transcript_18797/m.27797 type:complete len:217 (+) Transcript_18797:92-742(+)
MREKDDVAQMNPRVKDKVDVGTKSILDSDYVTEGPGRRSSAPIPSIFRDNRGEIHRLKIGGKRVNQLFSKKGMMRSGYIHNCTVDRFLISGKVEVWTLSHDGTEKNTYTTGELCSIPPYVPQLLNFLEDSVIVEYWDVEDFQSYFYHPYRNVVNIHSGVINMDTSVKHVPPLFQHLVPQIHLEDKSQLAVKVLWAFTGMVFGTAAGAFFVLNSRRR